MRKFNLFAVCALLFMSFALCGCEKQYEVVLPDNSEEQERDLAFTMWEATLTEPDGSVVNMEIAFYPEDYGQFNNSGFYVLDGEVYTFDYNFTQKNLTILTECLLEGGSTDTWWILEWTDDYMFLEQHPLVDDTRYMEFKRLTK